MRVQESATLRPTGMDCRPQAEGDTSYLLENVVYDREVRSWCTSIGLECWEPPPDSMSFGRAGTHRSLFEWTVNGVSYLFGEQEVRDEDTLNLCWIRRGGSGLTQGSHILVTGRTRVRGGNVYAPFGEHVMVLNGQDQPVKLSHNGMVTPFGFPDLPPAPTIVGIDPTRMAVDGPSANLTDQGAAPYPSFHLDPSGWTEDGQYQRDGDTAPGVEWRGPTSRSYLGLGLPVPGEQSAYSYKVAFVSDTGSISGLSPAARVSWTIPIMHNDGLHKAATVRIKAKKQDRDESLVDAAAPNIYIGTNEYEGNVSPEACKYAVFVNGIPRGPDNTVARILYRTKNMRDGVLGDGEVYYECAIIPDNETTTFTDFRPDQELIALAPTTDEAWTVDDRHTTAASWDNRLWVAGSSQNPTRVYYSAQGLPEQFGLTSFFDFSRSQGGAVTALVSYQNMLVVVREFSVEVIIPGPGPSGYIASTLHSSVGSRARNGVVPVPGGVMFVANDGIYFVDGNFSGGGVPRLQRMSDPVGKHFSRVNLPAIDSAVCAYSGKWREVWFHLPVDDDEYPSLGFVFHLDTGGWSLRGLAETDGPTGEDPDDVYSPWSFTTLCGDRNGEFLVGPVQQVEGSGTVIYGGDIMVLSRSGTYAVKTDATLGESGWTGIVNASNPVYSTVTTEWVDAPATKVQGMALEWVLLEADSAPLYSGWMTDRQYRWDAALRADPPTPGYPTVPLMPDEKNTEGGSALWGTSSTLPNPTVFRPLAAYDTSKLVDERMVTCRLDINPHIRDSVLVYCRTNRPLEFIGWRWNWNSTGFRQQGAR